MCSMGLGHLTLIIIEVGSRRRISGDDNGHNLCRERMWHPSRRMGMNLSFSSLSVLLVISSTRSMVNVDGWGGDGLEVIPNTVALIGVLRGLRRPLRLLGCGPPPPKLLKWALRITLILRLDVVVGLESGRANRKGWEISFPRWQHAKKHWLWLTWFIGVSFCDRLLGFLSTGVWWSYDLLLVLTNDVNVEFCCIVSWICVLLLNLLEENLEFYLILSL